MNGAAASTCSKLSSTSSRCLAARKRSAAWSADSPESTTIASVLTIAAGTSSGLAQRGERDEVRSVREVRLHRSRHIHGQPGLAHPARARQRQQSPAVNAEAVRDRSHVVRAADRPVRRRRQPVRPTRSGRQRGQRWEVRRQIADDELEEVLGAIEVLEPVLTEIPERDVGRQLIGDQLARGAGDQHLPTMAGRADPRRAMHVQADVIIGRTSASPVWTPIRTRSSTPSGQRREASDRCALTAAAIASLARAKATKNASPSVWTSRPSCSSNAARSRR